MHLSILEGKNVLDVGCGDRFMVILATDLNFYCPNKNLKSFQSQNIMLLNTKWDNLIDFSHRKLAFINNIELLRKESGAEAEIQNLIQLNSLKTDINSKMIEFPVESPKEMLSKRKLVEMSHKMLISMDEFQKVDIKRTESRTFTQGFKKFDNRLEHHRRGDFSNSSKRNVINSLQKININEEPLEKISSIQIKGIIGGELILLILI